MHTIVSFIAQYFVGIPVLVIAYLFWKEEKREKIRLIVLIVLSAIAAVILVEIATKAHADPRPFIRDGVKPYFTSSTDNGFPSDHTVFSTVAAGVALSISKKWGIGLLLVAIIIGSARVIAGVHHTQDVIAGVVIGLVSCGVSVAIMKLVNKK
jgi:membrane-associated phospholipid phosphatase